MTVLDGIDHDPAVPLLVDVAGPLSVDLDLLRHPYRMGDTIDIADAQRHTAADCPSRIMVWASDEPVPATLRDRIPQLITPLPHPVFHVGFDPSLPTPLPWSFRCNLCGATNERTAPLLAARSCSRCLSNVRYRATAHALASQLCGDGVALVDAPAHPEIAVLGVGDWPPLARELARVFTYVNTHLDGDPHLDLTVPPSPTHLGRYDVVLAGDVLEHVAPPLPNALGNLRRLLRPGGIVIVTVPWRGDGHVEHFPELHHYRVEDDNDGPVLVNERRDGTIERFGDLRFHGPGRSLEMRVFSRTSLVDALTMAGFDSIVICEGSAVRHGIAHRPGRPVPVIARVPPLHPDRAPG